MITTWTADKTRAAVLRREQARPGVHLNAIGGDCPGRPSWIRRSSRRRGWWEYAPQTRIEGEIQQLSAEFEVTELWEVLSSWRCPGRHR